MSKDERDKSTPAGPPPPEPNEPGDEATVEMPESELPPDLGQAEDDLQADLQRAQDRFLRLQAELENYRKRAAREMQDVRRYAGLPLMRDVLPVLDNMDRAIAAAEKTHDAASLLEGVKMVAQQLTDVLQRHDCVKINALHEPFDPHLHEAILQQPSGDHPPGTVVGETQTGYQLHDRVVRPSQVIVSAQSTEDE